MLAKVPEDAAYFHAQFRRVNKLPSKGVYTILDGVRGRGQYVGTYLAWEVRSPGWWGEGEIKFYLDGDQEFPTICGTGTEDYFGGAYNFENQRDPPLPDVHHALHGPGPGVAARPHLCPRSAFRALPLAHRGPGPFREGPQSDHPGAWAGSRAAATCRSRTTSPRWLTGIRPSRTPSSRRCRTRRGWRSSRFPSRRRRRRRRTGRSDSQPARRVARSKRIAAGMLRCLNRRYSNEFRIVGDCDWASSSRRSASSRANPLQPGRHFERQWPACGRDARCRRTICSGPRSATSRMSFTARSGRGVGRTQAIGLTANAVSWSPPLGAIMTTVAEKTKYRFVPPYSVIAKASFALVYSLWFSAALPFKEAVALLRIFRAVQGGGQSWPSRNHRTCRRCAAGCRLGFHVLRVRTPPHPAAAAMVLPTRRSGPAIRATSRRPSKSPSSPLACSGAARGTKPLDHVANAHLVERSGDGAGGPAAAVHRQRDRARRHRRQRPAAAR